MKIFFFTNYSTIGPSSRYRIYNYIEKYEKNGIKCKYKYFWGDYYLKNIITEKNYIARSLKLLFYYPFCVFRRFLSISLVLNYDIIHIERDFCPGIPPIGEYIITRILNKKMIYELDDAVYLTNIPAGKTEEVMRLASGIIAGNEILAEYANRFNTNVLIIPTAIDTEKYYLEKERIQKTEQTVTIGWIGTYTTLKYLDILKTVFEQLAKKYDFKLNVICNNRLEWNNNIKLNNIQWQLNFYIQELCKFDVGVMPLNDTEWEKGKCGFKLVQYMGVGLPIIASAVGVNKEIITHGENGFLANNEEEWYKYLEMLIVDKNLRKRMGEYGLNMVEKNYSINSNYSKLISFFTKIISV